MSNNKNMYQLRNFGKINARKFLNFANIKYPRVAKLTLY